VSRLRPKQARFVQEYVLDLNGTQAAIRAGYAAQSAAVTASQLLRFPKVAAAVDEALAARARRCDVTADRVLLELARVAYADPRDLFDATGRLKPPTALEDRIAPAVAGIEVIAKAGDDGATIHKIRLAPKVEAPKTLAQHLGMMRVDVTVGAFPGQSIKIVHEHWPADPRPPRDGAR
jgi:phage terminase small subunit